MRTHDEIISDNGGPSAVGRAIGVGAGTVKQWKRLSSIPAAHWKAIVAQGFATLEELAEAAAARRAGDGSAPQVAA